MRTRLLSCAEAEISEAVAYYNEQSPGLGYEFAAEAKDALLRLELFPNAWPVFSCRTRRCMVRRFPYGILYQVRPDFVLVVGVMHLSRDPKRWQDRCR